MWDRPGKGPHTKILSISDPHGDSTLCLEPPLHQSQGLDARGDMFTIKTGDLRVTEMKTLGPGSQR